MTDFKPSTSEACDHTSKYLTTSVGHPRLEKTDAASIRRFFLKYDQYKNEIVERAKQLTLSNSISTEAIKPVNLKFCVNAEWIESLIALSFIGGVTDYKDLEDNTLREYLEKESEESKEVINLDTLDEIVKKELKTDMSDSNAKSLIRNLFVSYHSILKRNGMD